MDGVQDPWRQLLESDGEMLEVAVLAVSPRIYGFLVNKVGDRADELTQATFHRVLQVRSGYRGGNPRSYVLGIARRVMLEHLRELARDETVPIEDVSVAAIDPRPSSVVVARAEGRLMLEALRRLPLKSQIVLELYYWEGLNDREIAEVLEGNANTIRGRRTQAKKQMGELLEELGSQPAPASTSMDFDRWARSMREQVFASAKAR